MLPILNEGNGTVQNTVLNFDAADLIDALSDDEPVQHHPSFFHRFFMVTCSIALWCGILTVGSCMLAIITFVVLAVMKAHG